MKPDEENAIEEEQYDGTDSICHKISLTIYFTFCILMLIGTIMQQQTPGPAPMARVFGVYDTCNQKYLNTIRLNNNSFVIEANYMIPPKNAIILTGIDHYDFYENAIVYKTTKDCVNIALLELIIG